MEKLKGLLDVLPALDKFKIIRGNALRDISIVVDYCDMPNDVCGKKINAMDKFYILADRYCITPEAVRHIIYVTMKEFYHFYKNSKN